MPDVADIACALFAAAVAGAVVILLRRRISPHLHASTDVIGYPVFNDFNGLKYRDTYYLMVLVAPLVSIAVFAATRWVAQRLLPAAKAASQPWLPPQRRLADTPSPAIPTWPALLDVVGALLRLIGPGAVLGIELAIDRNAHGTSFWKNVAAATLVYCVVIGVAAVAVARISATRMTTVAFREALSATNALGACLPVLGLWGVSRATIVVMSDGASHHYTWLPLSAAVAMTATLAAVVGIALWRRRDSDRWPRTVERRSVMLVTVPVVIFLGTAYLFNPAGEVLNSFETGQQISTLRFLQAGLLPWRDFVSDHGLLEDTLKFIPGALTLQNDAWGMVAGTTLLVIPLTFISLYLFAYRVGSGFALPLAVVVLFFHPYAISMWPRFIFWPLLLILLWGALHHRSARLYAILGFCLIAFAIITPEAVVCAFAAGAAVLIHDLYRGDLSRGHRLRSFTGAISLVAGGVGALLVLALVLLASGGLHGFIAYYQVALPGRDLMGTIPMEPLVRPFLTWAALPVAGLFVAFLIVAAKLRRRVVLSSEDFVMIAAALFVLVYYPKFLQRPDDGHALQAYGEALPLLIVEAHKGCVAADRTIGWLAQQVRIRRRPTLTGFAALLVTVATVPIGLWHKAEATADAVRIAVPAVAPSWPMMGWYATQQPLTHDMNAFLSAYLKPGDQLFDFTNSPGLLYVALDYHPAVRNVTVDIAVTQAGQNELIANLERSRPKLVLFFAPDVGGSLGNWDGIASMVRHYQLSQWILDHYHPLAALDSAVLYVKNGVEVPDPMMYASRLQTPLATQDLYFVEDSCDWGFASDFLNIGHPPDSTGVDTTVTNESGGVIHVAVPSGHHWSDYHWIEVRSDGAPLPADHFTIFDDQHGGLNRAISFGTRGGTGSVLRLPVGACSQWHGYTSSALAISHDPADPVASVRLLP